MLLIARIVRLAGPVTIAFLVAGIGIHVFDVSTQPGALHFVEHVASTLGSPFDDLFLPSDPKLRLTLNWGLAAVFYGSLASLLAYLFLRADVGIGSWRRTRRA
jgi:hypothetical protein